MGIFKLVSSYTPAGDPAPKNGSAENASVVLGGSWYNGWPFLDLGAYSANEKEPFLVPGREVVNRAP